MTDAELNKIATTLRDYYRPDAEVMALAAYVARLTDPTPLAECLERVAGERGGDAAREGMKR